MKPQIIRAEELSPREQKIVSDWLKANSCPWIIPLYSRIHITGQHFTVETWTIKTSRQSGTLWPKHVHGNWTPPTKTRKYHIHHELRWDS